MQRESRSQLVSIYGDIMTTISPSRTTYSAEDTLAFVTFFIIEGDTVVEVPRSNQPFFNAMPCSTKFGPSLNDDVKTMS